MSQCTNSVLGSVQEAGRRGRTFLLSCRVRMLGAAVPLCIVIADVCLPWCYSMLSRKMVAAEACVSSATILLFFCQHHTGS